MSARTSSLSFRWILALALGAALALAAACGETPSAPTDQESAQLEVALEQLAAEANGAGDVDAATAFGDGLSALRFGVRPTEIPVHLGDQSVRYFALVIGMAVRTPDGRELMRRSLVAWTGAPRPTALLQVTALSDESQFGFPVELASSADPTGRARGTWANLVRGHRLVATSGPVHLALAGAGEACPKVPSAAPLLCVMARWDVRLSGEFHALPRRDAREPTDDAALVIATEAQNVNGVLLTRKP